MKKVFYILNLLFLTLLVSGGSVFAAAPTQYIDENGTERTIPVANPTQIKGGTVNPGWNYLDSSSQMSFTIGQSTASSPVNIIINGQVTLSAGSWITVPENAVVNFYGATITSSLSITNSGAYYTIGNRKDGSVGGNFGNITFNSGTYTVKQTNTTSYPAIGSPDTSGGTITVNSAAHVTATSAANTKASVVVGVTGNNNCNVIVDGGSLRITTTSTESYGAVQVGSSGNFEINNQGYVQCGVNDASINPQNIAEIYVDLNSGVLNWYNYANNSGSNVNVGGEVTFPLANGASLEIGFNSNPGVVVFEEGSNVQIGTSGSDGVSGDFNNLIKNSKFINNGSVEIVNAATQPYGVGGVGNTWTNNPGSSLVVNDDQELTANTTNGSEITSSEPASLTLNGWINGSLTNYSSLIIDSAGSEDGATITNSLNNMKGGTTTLDGTLNITTAADNFQNSGNVELNGNVIFTQPGRSFQNSGILDIGPIGTVSGGAPVNLVNNQGGTVASQNPCYYGNQVYSIDQSL